MGAHIDINDDHELYQWARTFRVTPQELVRLVSEYGPFTEHIRDALKRESASGGGRHRGDNTKRRPG